MGMPLASLALAFLAASLGLRPAAGRGGEPTMDSWACLRPYLPEPVLRPRNTSASSSSPSSSHQHHHDHRSWDAQDERGGEPRSVWESEVWAAEAAARAEAFQAGSGGAHWGGSRAEYPRLSYARELGLPPPMQLVVVGGSTWNPRPDAVGHDPDQPVPMLAFSGEDPEAFAAAYAHYHGHGDGQRRLYAESIAGQQALLDGLSRVQRADMYVKMARMLYRIDSRDDIYEYGSGLPVLIEEVISDPKCMRLAMALLHRAVALVSNGGGGGWSLGWAGGTEAREASREVCFFQIRGRHAAHKLAFSIVTSMAADEASTRATSENSNESRKSTKTSAAAAATRHYTAVAHLPGLEAMAIRRGVWADFHHGLASMGRYDDQNLIARRLWLESPAVEPSTVPDAFSPSYTVSTSTITIL